MIEKKWVPSQRLTPKENRFVQFMVANPKRPFSDAAEAVYNVSNRNSANNLASHMRAKPHIIAELAKYSSTAEANLIKLANATTEFALEGGRDGAAYASVAEKTNNSVLDRLHGKATTKIEQTTQAVVLNIDLTGTV